MRKKSVNNFYAASGHNGYDKRCKKCIKAYNAKRYSGTQPRTREQKDLRNKQKRLRYSKNTEYREKTKRKNLVRYYKRKMEKMNEGSGGV